MYYQSFIAEYRASVGGVLEIAITGLSNEDIMEVMKGLTRVMINRNYDNEVSANDL